MGADAVYTKGSTSVFLPLTLRGLDGRFKTGLTYASGLTVTVQRDGVASYRVVTLTAGTLGTFGADTIVETQQLGTYQLCLGDTDFAAGAGGFVVSVTKSDTIMDSKLRVALVDFNLQSATPNVNVQSVTAGAITSAAFGAGAITSTVMASGCITATQLAASCITATQLAASCITNAKFASAAITSTTFAVGAITNSVLASQCIQAAHFSSSAISSTVLASGAITATAIANGAISNTKFAAGAIDNAAIADGAITSQKAPNLDAQITTRSTLTAQGVWDVLTTAITTANSIGVYLQAVLAKLTNMIEADGADYRFKANALEQGPSGGGGGGSGTGSGDTEVGHNWGETDALRVLDDSGNSVDSCIVRAYLFSEYQNGIYNLLAMTYTGPDGRWVAPIYLNTGYTYAIVFEKPNTLGPTVQTVSV